MPFSEDNTCPFCGARFSPGASACPACDLPLLGEDGSRPPEREPAPFDGASLFDEAFPGEEFLPQRSFQPPLATERRNREGGESMRCVVVAMNRAEAEMLEDMLRAEGVPCMVPHDRFGVLLLDRISLRSDGPRVRTGHRARNFCASRNQRPRRQRPQASQWRSQSRSGCSWSRVSLALISSYS